MTDICATLCFIVDYCNLDFDKVIGVNSNKQHYQNLKHWMFQAP